MPGISAMDDANRGRTWLGFNKKNDCNGHYLIFLAESNDNKLNENN